MRIDVFFSTLCVVIRHGIDPHTHRIAPHQLGIARLQQFGRRSHIRHFAVEPQVVLSESRMTGGRERLRSRLARNLYSGNQGSCENSTLKRNQLRAFWENPFRTTRLRHVKTAYEAPSTQCSPRDRKSAAEEVAEGTPAYLSPR
jgi:hypothetical protein